MDALGNLVHDADFWFEDGNVVLVARNYAFRVYRGLLAVQSTVFGDMFSSSSASVDEVYQGSPLVRVSDSPEDFRHFLRVLCPRTQRYVYNDGEVPKVTFDQVSALIRLAHKYDVQDVERQALSALMAYYTADLDQYDQRDDDDIDNLPVAFADPVPHAIAAINLARLTDTPTVLPLAFYRCCTLGSKVLDGYRREDNSVDYLTPADLRRCMEGRDELGREALTVIVRIFRAECCATCRTPPRCRTALWLMLVDAASYEHAADCNVLGSWHSFIDGAAKKRSLCGDCKEAIEARDDRERRRIWRRLPEIFGLDVEGWSEEGRGKNDCKKGTLYKTSPWYGRATEIKPHGPGRGLRKLMRLSIA